MNNYLKFFLILLLFINVSILFNHQLNALETLVLDDSKSSYALWHYLEYFEDKSSKLTIDDVTKPDISEKFIQNTKVNLSLGYFSNSNIWIRFQLKNNSQFSSWLLEAAYPFINNIEFYYKDSSGNYNIKKTGLDQPFNSRDIKHRNYTFKIPILHNQEVIYYICFNMQSNIFMPLKIYSYDFFFDKEHNDQILLGLYYGFMLLMLILSIIIFLIIRDKNYLYYILFCICWILCQMGINGISYEYLWPKLPWWNSYSLIPLLYINSLVVLFFINNFLLTKKNVPLIHIFIFIFKIFIIINLILSFFIKFSIGVKILAFFSILWLVTVFIAGLICFLKGYKPARIFLLAWSLFLISLFFHSLTISGIIPNNNITRSGFQISSLLLILLIPFALLDKYNTLRKEKVLADKTIAEKEKDKFASIGMLLGGISHEIYNPLSGITGPLENLRNILYKIKIPETEKINKYIDYIDKNTQRIDNIIKNIRALYKKQEFDKEKLDINEIAQSVIENYKDDSNKNIIFKLDINKEIEIYGDKNALYQILNNLISNSVESIKEKGKIIISLEKNNNEKFIKVEDNGTGIDNKEIEKIFNAFYTTKSIGNNIGLGLYIVKDLIIKLGWDIIANSEENKGSCFSIIIKD